MLFFGKVFGASAIEEAAKGANFTVSGMPALARRSFVIIPVVFLLAATEQNLGFALPA